jgi:tetratricopeptide (TPR) repeat protein
MESADLAERPLLAVAAPVIAALTGHAERSEELMTALERHPDPWVQAMQPFVRAQIAENEGRLDVMAEHLDVALERFRAVGDRWGTAAALSELASQRMLRGDLDGAEAALAETEGLMRELGAGPGGGVVGLRGAELLLRRRDLEGARAALTRAVEHAGQREERLLLRALLGLVTWRLGDAAAAQALLDEALAEAARLPDQAPGGPHQRAMVTGLAARVAVEQGDLERAGELFAAAHEAMVRARDLPIAGRVGEGAALYALRLGRPADGAEMLGAAVALRGAEDFGNPDTAALLEELREALGDDTLAAALAAGRALDADAALARLDPATVGG